MPRGVLGEAQQWMMSAARRRSVPMKLSLLSLLTLDQEEIGALWAVAVQATHGAILHLDAVREQDDILAVAQSLQVERARGERDE